MKTVFENTILSLVVVAQILSLLYIAALFINRKNKASVFVNKLGDKGFMLAFIVALVSTLGSLFYSDVLGYNPCKFCWFQRIFMYPQVLLLGLALYKKDYGTYLYGLIFSIAGGLLALNHYILQTTGTSIVPCSTVGQSVACNKIFVMHLGYITIPFMALTAFVLMTLSLILWKQTRK